MTNDSIVYASDFQVRLPETFRLLTSANLRLHSRVTRVILHGSRGLKGGFRPESDIDLSLLTDTRGISQEEELGEVLHAVLETSLSQWQACIELDLAAVFDLTVCGLLCFDREAYDDTLCPGQGIDCLGIYKVQKGFSGFAPKSAMRVKEMYPCFVIWRRPDYEILPCFKHLNPE